MVSYNTVLTVHPALGRLPEAQVLLQEMAQNGQPANSVTYTGVLSACVAARDRRSMGSTADRMQAAGTARNAATCSILLRSLTGHPHVPDVQRAIELIEQMREPVDEVLPSGSTSWPTSSSSAATPRCSKHQGASTHSGTTRPDSVRPRALGRTTD